MKQGEVVFGAETYHNGIASSFNQQERCGHLADKYLRGGIAGIVSVKKQGRQGLHAVHFIVAHRAGVLSLAQVQALWFNGDSDGRLGCRVYRR